MCDDVSVARLTREQSTAQTRLRVIAAAQQLFRERGYAATSLEQIAVAAGVTKGAIYGHFATKEDLLLSAIESSPTPDYAALVSSQSTHLRERLREFGRVIALDGVMNDSDGLAVSLEFIAALLRNPGALARFGADVERRLREMADDDEDVPLPGVPTLDVWVIGQCLFAGLQLYRLVAPELLTPELFGRAFELLANLYPER
jgi:AcrR family transcriptional regulator